MTADKSSNRKVGNLRRPHGNDLETNYEKHDVGQEYVIKRLTEEGYDVEEWGIDMRDHEGDELVFEHDAVDLKVYDGDTLMALVEVKTKGDSKWMGRFNMRHHENYVKIKEEFDVPIFMVMCHVDKNSGKVYDKFVAEMTPTCVYRDGTFPDGNRCATIRHDARQDFVYMLFRMEQ